MFSDKLKQLRNNRGLTQQRLADDLGISKSSLANYECGLREPQDNATWKKIASYFNVTIDFLMDVDSPTPHIVAASTGSLDSNPIIVHSYGNKKKDKLLKTIQENDIPDNILDIIDAAIAPYKK